ncbi:MAG: PIG-L family deacetylase, partial [Methanococcaceae archaeon]
MMQKLKLLFLITVFLLSSVYAQPEKILNSSEIGLALKKLNTLGSVLYIAAHPDDENTALLSYFSSGRNLRTGYLAMTRGDGGQNLIGSEQGDLLGLIRTQELLDARRIDGAEQFFTRAFDFGFSKNPDETFRFWDKQKILSDVVRIIRKFKPDVIVTRFPITGEGGHGHHTASAILAEEAFNLTAPEWQAKRLYLNGWLPMLQERKADLSKLITVDVGQFNTYLGKSYTEIAAESRSMHKSQGFGTAGSRGESLNYFEFREGSPVKKDLFEDIDLTWNRVKGAGKLKQLLEKAESDYSPANPSAVLPLLLQAFNEMNSLDDNYWIPLKKKELAEIIQSLMGLWFEGIASDFSAVPGESIKISGMIVNRSSTVPLLKAVYVNDKEFPVNNIPLENGKPFKEDLSFTISQSSPFSQPYWLENKHDNGSFVVNDTSLIGKPENDPLIKVSFVIAVDGTELRFDSPLLFRWVDPVKGERYRPFEILPPVVSEFDSKVLLFPDKNPKELNVRLDNNAQSSNGTVNFEVPSGWSVEPKSASFSFSKKDEEKIIPLKVIPPESVSENSFVTGSLKITADVGGKKYSYSLTRIEYDHIPIQVYLPPSEVKVVRFNSAMTVKNIGYYMGAGDDIPPYLEQLGFNVTLLNDNALLNNHLERFDAIITGVRAYNTKPALQKAQKNLMDYVNKGGNLLVQYNVNQPLVTDPGIYPL